MRKPRTRQRESDCLPGWPIRLLGIVTQLSDPDYPEYLDLPKTIEGQVRALLDNFDGDALGMWRTAGRVRSAWARSSSSRMARN